MDAVVDEDAPWLTDAVAVAVAVRVVVRLALVVRVDVGVGACAATLTRLASPIYKVGGPARGAPPGASASTCTAENPAAVPSPSA